MILKSKAGLFVFLVFLFISVPHSAFALDSFSVDVITEKQSVYVGNQADYVLNITNNLNESKEVQIVPTISYNSWFPTQQNHSITIDSGDSKTMDVKIVPPQGTLSGSLAITVSVCEVRSNVCTDTIINILVIDKSQLKIISFASEAAEFHTGEQARFFFRLENLGESNIVSYKFQLDVFKNDVFISNKTIDLEKISSLSLYPRDNNASIALVFDSVGDYRVTARIIDSTGAAVQSEDTYVTVTLPPKVQTETIVETAVPGIFSKKMNYVVQNKDSKVNTVEVIHSVFITPLIYSYSQVPETRIIDEKEFFVWTCNLEAQGLEGDSCEIEVVVNYWIIYLVFALFYIITFCLYRALEKPGIKKLHVSKKGFHSIHIHVKNNSRKPIDDVVVTDKVPSVFSISGDFTVKPTTMKKKHNCVELIWKIGKLNSKEERVLTYNLKSVVEVEGGAKLPPVEIKAVNAKGRHEKVMSKPLLLS